jgi:hypothetical protein
MVEQACLLDVAARLGARLKRVTATEWAGPCPKCAGRDRFSVNVKRGVFNCRVCEIGGDTVALVRHVLGCGFREALEFVGDERAAEVSAQPGQKAAHGGRVSFGGSIDMAHGGPVSEDDKRIADAVALFRESTDPIGTVVERYFASRRLEIGDLAGRVIRWSPRAGAMVALFRNIVTGNPQAVSRTFLDSDARKIERKFLGPVGGAAVMMDGFDAVTSGLHIAEGIETAQAARQLGLRPTWALGSAGSIAAFAPLPGVECLTLLAENDLASARAVEACAARWHDAEREVLINRPIRGKDLNDAIRRAA